MPALLGRYLIKLDILTEIKKIAEHFGYEAQSNQLIEECAELIQALSKYRRSVIGVGQPLADYKKTIVLDNLLEEIADVEIMLEQIKHLLQISAEDIQAIKLFKVNRTKERIAESKRG